MLSQSAHDVMLSQSHELSVAFKGIMSIDIEINYVLVRKSHRIAHWLGVVRRRKWPFCFNHQNVLNKVPTYKTNLHSTENIAGSNSAGAWMFVLTSVVCFKVHISGMGR